MAAMALEMGAGICFERRANWAHSFELGEDPGWFNIESVPLFLATFQFPASEITLDGHHNTSAPQQDVIWCHIFFNLGTVETLLKHCWNNTGANRSKQIQMDQIETLKQLELDHLNSQVNNLCGHFPLQWRADLPPVGNLSPSASSIRVLPKGPRGPDNGTSPF